MNCRIPYLLLTLLFPACFTTGAVETSDKATSQTGCRCPSDFGKFHKAKDPAADAINGGSISIRVESEPGMLLSMYSANAVVRQIADHNILETLVRLNPKTGLPKPSLAISWSIDEKTGLYLFELASNVRWHDGKPLTANDVKFTFDRLLDPAGGAVLRKHFRDVDKVTITSDTTFSIKLDRPHPDFVALLSWLPILPAHVFGNAALQSHHAALAPIGTGPYKFKSWKPGRQIVLVKNKDYAGVAASINQITYRIVPDKRVALDLFKVGELDIVSGMGSNRKNRIKDGRTIIFPKNVFEAWIYNTSRPVFADRATRIAVGSLIDKRAIRCSIMDCLADIIDHPWPISMPVPIAKAEPAPVFSLKRSRQMLEAAGWIDRDGDGIRERNGVKLKFTLLLPDTGMSRRRAVTLIQHDMSKAGVHAQVLPVSWGVYTDRLRKHAFDASIISVSNRPPFDPRLIFHSRAINTGRNFGMFANRRVDELTERLAGPHSASFLSSVREELRHEILNEQPLTFTFRPLASVLVRDGIEGISVRDGWLFEPKLYLTGKFGRPK